MEFPGFDAAIESRLAAVVDNLALEFQGIHDRAAIRATVEKSALELSGGEVTTFVPILAERFARERLRAQAQSRPTATSAAWKRRIVTAPSPGGHDTAPPDTARRSEPAADDDAP